ncbi:MAG: hypothetical protein FJZ43_01510 [Candidatus Staskawiczbacteria bacterium]|nr:hypothetical protein [Candidatus Staskawiczbacteria bacterium]
MISWFFIIIVAYFLFSIASFGDKLVLKQAQSPKLYIFYVGILSVLTVFLIPFFGISIPSTKSFFWIILTSLTVMLGLYFLYYAIEKYEVSRVIPITGSTQPLFILFFSWLISGSEILKLNNILAFLILIIASMIISLNKKLNLTKGLLLTAIIASFVTSLSFIFTKLVFNYETFFNGIIWIGIFNFLFVLLLFLDKSIRDEVLYKRNSSKKIPIPFIILAQLSGGLGGILQNYAIYLAPISSLAIINVLRVIQYVFLFIITWLFSAVFPKLIKEDITKKSITGKVISIILIIIGLGLLFLL